MVFVLGVARLEQLPPVKGIEIAFAGRSNVGKSSLINALTGVNGLARASNTPGRTRELNFFDVNGQIALVDMPGYGYAKASKQEVKQWQSVLKRISPRPSRPDPGLCPDRRPPRYPGCRPVRCSACSTMRL